MMIYNVAEYVTGWRVNGLHHGETMADLSQTVFDRSTNEAFKRTNTHTHTHIHIHIRIHIHIHTYAHTHTHTHAHAHTQTHTRTHSDECQGEYAIRCISLRNQVIS